MGCIPTETAPQDEPQLALPAHYVALKTNSQRMLRTWDSACTWGQTPDGGMNRLSLNDDDKSVREWFVRETERCGCKVTVDAMGNIFAVRPGRNNDIPPIAIGSHLDTQPTGGRYDGILGVTTGMEVLQTLHANNITTYAPLAIIDWTNEEGARFPPAMLASGTWAGAFTTEYAHARTDPEGKTIKGELERIGFLGETPCSHEAMPLSAHFELHIEQGPVLDAANQSLAVVKGIQAIRWYNIDLVGREGHTGTTPMATRADALLGSALMTVAANTIALSMPASANAMATVAVVHAQPQSINTIAGKVRLCLDLRAATDSDGEELDRQVRQKFTAIAKEHGLGYEIECFWTSPALQFDPVMVDCVRASTRSLGCPTELTSGAGHDSGYTSMHVPTGMIFTRCREGISHNPNEYTSPEDVALSAEAMLGAYLRYDEHLRKKIEGKSV
ncbi:hypothetical protein SEUCBS140593_007507 [Sporothrix eucalyptigena]|uniref:N-carbamoyl-L-amino-acid hydrolase n=1 Tax=Sporothrix eucalyptigena TaxID=1812306 RepID=A0ABP0CE77_9PEZI